MSEAKKRAILYGSIKAACITLIVFGLIFTLFTLGPPVETRFFPVVSKLRILKIEQFPTGESVVQAEFNKLRPCEYVGIAWYKRNAELGDFERVPVILQRAPGDRSSPNRPEGVQRAGPWLISLSPDDVRDRSFAQLTHRCHALWVTTTDFWP